MNGIIRRYRLALALLGIAAGTFGLWIYLDHPTEAPGPLPGQPFAWVPTYTPLPPSLTPSPAVLASPVPPTPLPASATPAEDLSSPPPEMPAAPAPTTSAEVTPAAPPEPIANRVVVRFAAGTSEEQRAAYVASLGGTIRQDITALDTVVIDVPAAAAAQPLPPSPVVAASEPDYVVSALGGPLNDPLYAQQWALPVIGAPAAWDLLPPDTPSLTVAVLDTGICAAHPDLAGRVVAGWDFVEQDGDPQDEAGHGCAVAGIIAANANDGTGIAGVAPNTQILPLRVLDASGLGSYSDVAAALVYAADHGARIINLSLGGPAPSDLLESAVQYAAARGALVIAASGNSGTEGVLYPAAYAPVIAVGAVDANLQRSSFTSYGPELDLLAPGRDILSLAPGGGYALFSGTSFAAPQVAGVAALDLALGRPLTTAGVVHVDGIEASLLPTPTPSPTPDSDPGGGDLPAAPNAPTLPLRVMVPSEPLRAQFEQAGVTNLAQVFPQMDLLSAFSPGPRMDLGLTPPGAEQSAASTTSFRTLALLVDFSDNPAHVAASGFDTLLFGTSGKTVRAYYSEVSYGQLDVVTVNLPSSLGWKRAPNAYSYYVNGRKCLSTDLPNYGYPNNCQRLTEDLVQLVNPVVDFSQYDNNDDGWVDTVFVIHAGTGAEFDGDPYKIWSHSWGTRYPPLVDGVYVGSYTTEPEYWLTSGDMTHGVYVHELAHSFGLPDLYDVTDSTVEAVGDWSLMGGGSWNGWLGDTPSQLDAWSRLYLGFTTAADATTWNRSISLPNVEQNASGAIYRLNTGAEGEYFLLENRQQRLSDSALPASGLLIWHVDENVPGSNQYECLNLNNYNCTGTDKHFRVALEQADGLLHLEKKHSVGGNSGDAGDPWPGSSNRTTFSFSSTPNTSSYYSSTDPGIVVSSISASGATMGAQIASSSSPFTSCSAVTEIPTAQCNALTALYNGTGGPGWNNHSGWLALGQPCRWYGVTCDGGKVVGLSLSRNHLTGTIPAGWWGLTGLASLDLSSNQLSGPLPVFPSGLSTALNLAQNALAGEVPASYQTITGALDLSYNMLTAADPALSAFLDAKHYGNWTRTQTVAPGAVQIAPVSTASLKVSWAPISYGADAGNYRVSYALAPGGPYTLGCTTTSKTLTSCQVNTLARETLYYVVVQSYTAAHGWQTNNLLSGYSAEAVGSTALSTPVSLESPANASASASSTPQFTWKAASYGASYQIQIDNDPLFASPEQDVTTSALKHTSIALADGMRYYWRVRAANAQNALGPWSTAWSVVIDTAGPAAPLLAAPRDRTNVTALRPRFAWAASAGAVAYRLQVDDQPTFASPEIDQTALRAAYYDPPAGLLHFGTLYWRVLARDAAGNEGPWSATFRVTLTLLTAPADGSYLTSGTPVLTWAALGGASGYTVEIDQLDSGDNYQSTGPAAALGAAVLTYRPTLAVGQYRWRVSAGGQSTPYWTFTVTSPAPPAPVLLDPPALNALTRDNTPAFSWQALTVTTGAPFSYQLQVDPLSTFRTPRVDVTPDNGATTYTPGSALPDGLYYWRVRALNAVGMAGLWSAPRVLRIDTTPPAAPLLLAPADQSASAVLRPRFMWQAVAGAARYQLEVSDKQGFAPLVLNEDARSLTAYTSSSVNLTPGTTYWWRVTAIDAAGNTGQPSEAFQVIISSTAPPAVPALLAPLNAILTDNPVALAWRTVNGATGYQIQIDQDARFLSPEVRESTAAPAFAASVLAPDGRYYWRVRAVNGEGIAGAWSAAGLFTLDTTAPGVPTLLAPANGSGTALLSPRLAWQAVSGATQYRVQWAADPSGLTDAAPSLAVGNVSAATVTLPGYGRFYWRAQAGDSLGHWGAWSSPFALDITLLRAPTHSSYTTTQRPVFVWSPRSGALRYWLQVAADPSFASLVINKSDVARTVTAFAAPAALPYGRYYWRLCADLGGGCATPGEWSLAWTFTVTRTPPAAPTLAAPRSGALIASSTTTFFWNAAPGAHHYQVQVDDVATFASPVLDTTVSGLSRLSPALPNGLLYWRVRAVNDLDIPGAWSAAWTLTVDTGAPSAPALIYPLDDASITNPQLTFTWSAVPGAARYEIQLDTLAVPAQPPIAAGTAPSYRLPTPLARESYYWRVRAVDAAGNIGAWSSIRQLTVVAGYTVSAAPTPTAADTPPDATLAPTQAATPGATPSPGTALLRIESDAASVQRAGTWTAHLTDQASGGGYLYSSGAPDDVLSLTFAGTQVEVIFVQHPALGRFVLELDGVPVQTVDSAAADAIFGASAALRGLAAGPHTLRIVPLEGTIALDAFAVEQLAEPAIAPPTATPTEVTPGATLDATPVPTNSPTATPVPPTPTAAPLPQALPVSDAFEGGSHWIAAGAWRPNAAGHSGVGWFADGAAPGQVSTLTGAIPVDLRAALAPQLSVWQKVTLPAEALFAVDVSLDGGTSWAVVDSQPGQAQDWTLHMLDLTPYRGLVIVLRFRLDSMSVPPGITPGAGLWLDDLLIQEAPPTPTALPPTPTAPPTVEPTLLPTETPAPTAAPILEPSPSPTQTAAPPDPDPGATPTPES